MTVTPSVVCLFVCKIINFRADFARAQENDTKLCISFAVTSSPCGGCAERRFRNIYSPFKRNTLQNAQSATSYTIHVLNSLFISL